MERGGEQTEQKSRKEDTQVDGSQPKGKVRNGEQEKDGEQGEER